MLYIKFVFKEDLKKMKRKGLIVALIVMSLILSIASVTINAAPAGVTVVKVVEKGNTRDDAWKNTVAGVMNIPAGEDFTGGRNHCVYHIYTDDFEAGQEYYTYWILKVTGEADGATLEDSTVVMSEDPAWLISYTAPGEGEVEAGRGLDGGFWADFDGDNDGDYTIKYSEVKSKKYVAVGRHYKYPTDGWEGTAFVDVTSVQWRLHSETTLAFDVKYLIISKTPLDLIIEDDGEVDGYTNDKPIKTSEGGNTETTGEAGGSTTKPTTTEKATSGVKTEGGSNVKTGDVSVMLALVTLGAAAFGGLKLKKR